MKATDWISVKDKLPKLGEMVIICQTFANDSRIVRKATFVKKDGYKTFIDEHGVDCCFISHWQRIVLPKVEL